MKAPATKSSCRNTQSRTPEIPPERVAPTGDSPVRGDYYDKRSARNPIERRLVAGFDRQLSALIRKTDTSRILEIGCGEGNIVSLIKKSNPNCYYVAADIDAGLLDQAVSRAADETWLIDAGRKFAVPYESDSFTLVLMIEVLEHVPDPARMLSEASRVSSRHIIASVPDEPTWRILNMLRLKYWSRLGNTPGHINHWGRRSFGKLLSEHSTIQQFWTPFPWLMALCRTRPAGT